MHQVFEDLITLAAVMLHGWKNTLVIFSLCVLSWVVFVLVVYGGWIVLSEVWELVSRTISALF